MARLLRLFRSERASNGTDHELARHDAVIRRGERLLRVVAEYAKADEARRGHR